MAIRWLYIAFALLLDGAAGLAGALLPERLLARSRATLVAFAVGALLGAVFLDLLPEATARLGAVTFSWALASFVVLALFEWALSGRERRAARPPSLVISLLGADALHNVSDGAAIAASFLVSVRLGLVTSLAVIVHEVPEEVGDFVLLRAAGLGRGQALLALASIQFTAVLGALGALLAFASNERFSAIMLALAAGSFLYIGATDLLAQLIRDERPDAGTRRQAMFGLLLGIGVIVASTAL